MNKISLIVGVALVSVLAAACGAAGTANNANTNKTTNTANTAASPTPAATESTTTSTDTAAPGSPTATYKAAYAARKTCDLPALKKIFSKDVIDFLSEMGKVDTPPKSLDAMLKDMCAEAQADTDAARNEKINGDHATIEYQGTKGEWKTMDFVKEDGVWKLSLPTPEDGKDNKPK